MDDLFFLGLDYSTQQLKSLIFDGNGNIVTEECVEYDKDMQHYGTVNGVYSLGDGVVCAPSAMWIEATDLLFSRLSTKCNLGKIISLTGSAQQHSTIFWGIGTSQLLFHLDSKKSLRSQLEHIFSRPLSPTWMDSSTTETCKALEDLFGGKFGFQTRVGSSLANRFSGPQIMKAFKDDVTLNNRTEAITLVSNGMCSVFTGLLVGMDMSDAAGTGLQKCGSLDWDLDICSAVSSNLHHKLGRIIHSNSVTGYLNDYFVKRYNMNPRCQIVAFTGDNPSSVVGMQLSEGDLCLSLGTSDTLFACLPKPPAFVNDIPLFVFPHPLSPNTFVTLLCYKNGAQVRQSLCEEYCQGDWAKFSNLLESTPSGNDGVLGVFYDVEEITPHGLRGRYFIDTSTQLRLAETDLAPGVLIRSLIEGQLLAKHDHFLDITTEVSPHISRLLITGGASSNKAILQVASDIFANPVFTLDTVNSAALGSVFRAVLATENEGFSVHFIAKITSLQKVCEPQSHMVFKSRDKQVFDLFKQHLLRKDCQP